MCVRMPNDAPPEYRLIFAAVVARHFDRIERRHHSQIRAAIGQQLRHEPDREARNRKPLRRSMSFGATWELRCGPGNRFRVFYHVDRERRDVVVLAVGVKERNRLTIGGEEIEQ